MTYMLSLDAYFMWIIYAIGARLTAGSEQLAPVRIVLYFWD